MADDLASAKQRLLGNADTPPFSFGSLPNGRSDPLWTAIRSEYNLSLAELVALKNARCQAAAAVPQVQDIVIGLKDFTEKLSKTVRFELGEEQCPRDKLIGLDGDGVIEKALKDVMEGVSKETSAVDRVPPLAITRVDCGGKTTALLHLFDAIKNSQLNEENVNVMIISFNGYGDFKPVEGETQAHAIIRNIVKQLVDPNVDQKKIRCTKDVLDKYIGDSPFVLLIDELNQLNNPLDRDAKQLLQDLFLKKKNRYLVFTSHVEMNIDPKAVNGIVSESDPGVKSISLPVSTDLDTLRNMPRCGSLNAATVALYGGIPSLIYSVRGLKNKTPKQRFNDAGLKAQLINDGVDMTSLLKEFVCAVITGERNVYLKMFQQFAITNYEEIQWPICYIQCILGLFQNTEKDIIPFILNECNNLVTLASTTGTGLDWECVINIALGFRCLYQKFHGSKFPFSIIPPTLKPNKVFALALPDDVQSIKAAKNYISKLYKASFPALVLATPTYSNFPIVDGLVAFCSTPKEIVICGYQAKLGKGLPKQEFDKKQGLHKGVLLQGGASDDDNLFYKGWEHWNKKKVQGLLGISLKDLYPAAWPSFNSLAAAEETIIPGKNKKIKQNK